ncbi:TPA: hypothetical protein ACSPXK_005798 [Pseudomonas aeruginosa]
MTNELTDVRCPCGDEFPADSYDAGFIAGAGMCQNCDAAMPPKDIPAPVEQAGGDEREAAIAKFAETCPMTAESAAGGKSYDIELRRYYLLGWDDRAALAQPSQSQYEASFEEWLANELEGEDGQPVPAAVCDIALARRAFNHWPKLEQPAKVGGVRFSAGVSSRLVVEAAQRLYEFESTPEQEAERIERLQAFREQLDPLNLAPHAKAFNEAPAEALKSEQAEAELPEGWMLVPMDPTSQMTFVGQSLRYDAVNSIGEIYRQMLAAAPGKEVPQAWLEVQAERKRQVEVEGWTPLHDDEHADGQMAQAAGCYALHAGGIGTDWPDGLQNGSALFWPWDKDWWKPTTPRRDLVKACALALAEIERLDRAGISQNPQPGATTASS